MEKVVKFKIKLGLLFTTPDLVNEFQMICLKGTYGNRVETKCGMFGQTYGYG